MNYLLNTLSKLVQIETDSTKKLNYLKCAKLIAKEGRKIGLKATVLSFTPRDKIKRHNVLLQYDAGAKETVMLLTHFDCVPLGEHWETNPLKVTRKGKRIYGRGVADDKGGIAAALCAIKECIDSGKVKRNIKLFAVCDEEVGGENGIGLVIKKRPSLLRADFCATLDGDLDALYIGCCGIARGKIIFKGKGGHAGYDFNTGNLLHKCLPLLNGLAQYSKVRRKKISFLAAQPNPVHKKMFGRFNITIMKAGTQFNVLPAELTIGFDMRLLPEENPAVAVKQFKKFVISKSKKFYLKPEFDILTTRGYYEKPTKWLKIVKDAAEKTVGKKLKLVSQFGGTDSRFVSYAKVPAYTFGPAGKGAHSSKESITIAELEKTKNFVKQLI